MSKDGKGCRCPYSRRHGCASMSPHGSKMAVLHTRRTLLRLAAATALTAPRLAAAQERRYTIAFANLTDDPGARLEGLGFTGGEVRSSFVLGARGLPIDLVLYDNARD